MEVKMERKGKDKYLISLVSELFSLLF